MTEWQKAWTNAEKVVGYPPSYFSLRALLSDEMSNIAMHMPRLLATNHPLLKTAKRLIYDGKNALQTRGLIVLLVAKAAGVASAAAGTGGAAHFLSGEAPDGILENQRSLAEITEMIHSATLIHRGIVNIPSSLNERTAPAPNGSSKADLEFGNKLAVLSGDFLLSTASVSLSKLGNCGVVEMMASALGDIMEGQFLSGSHQQTDKSEDHGCALDLWRRSTWLMAGSLLAHGCKSAVTLAGHSRPLQNTAFELGTQLAYAYQLQQDLQPFADKKNDWRAARDNVSLASVPVALHLELEPDHRHLQGTALLDQVLSNDIVQLKAHRLCLDHCDTARDLIGEFPTGTATVALQNIVNAIGKS